MNSETGPSFDSSLGGVVDVTSTFTMREFGTPRIEEILMLSEAINDPPAKGQLFQRLPKHMRRRQMSHNECRLPRKLRVAIGAQKKELPPKRPSRKYRRKPKNIVTEYGRRQKNKTWLETHVWHAKRFHMMERWGYRLPDRATNKGFRANYRAARSHCLLIDMSYMACIELVGPEPMLLAGLSQCSSPECGLTFAARTYTDGLREGTLPMYHPNSYPHKIIGNVSFLWRPQTKVSTCSLWLWVHPSFHQEVVECLSSGFNLNEPVLPADSASSGPKYKSEKVTMTLLKDKLNRFRLVGPLSSSVLADALTTAPFPQVESVDDLSVIEVIEPMETDDELDKLRHPGEIERKLKACTVEMQRVYREDGWAESWQLQQDLAVKLHSTPPSLFPPEVALGLLVSDPRLSVPQLRTKSICDGQGRNVLKWNAELAMSAIWSESARQAATNSLLSDWQVGQIRGGHTVPDLQVVRHGASLPLLLIQQTGCRGPSNNGLAAGWDVVLPHHWAMPFWRGLVLRGARPGGFREASLLRLVTDSLKTALPPDSAAGRAEAEKEKTTLQEKYFKLPPAKRPNYIKLGVCEPFATPWDLLSGGDWYVIRDAGLLRRLSSAVDHKQRMVIDEHPSGIVAVSIRCSKGKPEALARLHLPDAADLRTKQKLEEPVHPDENRADRIKKRKENKVTLNQLKRKKKKGAELVKEQAEAVRSGTREFMNNAWLPTAPCENLRQLVGYVTQGDFSHSEACGAAHGFITLKALLLALELSAAKSKPPMLLVRNVRHTVYHQATFKILLD